MITSSVLAHEFYFFENFIKIVNPNSTFSFFFRQKERKPIKPVKMKKVILIIKISLGIGTAANAQTGRNAAERVND